MSVTKKTKTKIVRNKIGSQVWRRKAAEDFTSIEMTSQTIVCV